MYVLFVSYVQRRTTTTIIIIIIIIIFISIIVIVIIIIIIINVAINQLYRRVLAKSDISFWVKRSMWVLNLQFTFGNIDQLVQVSDVIRHHHLSSCCDMFQATEVTRRMHASQASGVREAQLKACV